MYRSGIITLAFLISLGLSANSLANEHVNAGPSASVQAVSVLSEGTSEAYEHAQSLFIKGDYEKARHAGEALGSAQGYALAAEALSAQIMLGLLEKPHKQSKRAFALAQKAIALDPHNSDAILQYTLTYGFVTRTSTPITAWRKKYPSKSLTLIESLRMDFPNDPRADALMAAWHLGIVRKTGVANGEKWFGASLDRGIELYEDAISRAPEDIIIHSHFALTRFAISPQDYNVPTRALLEQIVKMPATTAVERDVQSRMADILGDFDDLKSAIKKTEHFLDSKARV